MTSFGQLTESDIHRWAGDASFARSRSYVRGAILHPRRAGATLKAQCVGSAPQPYYVQATLSENGVASAACSCPVGDSGRCKHVAALLQTWLADSDLFIEVEDLDAALERRSKAELIALLRRIMERYPDLEMLLELPLPHDKAGGPVDIARIQRQVAHAFGGYDEYWGGTAVSVIELDQLADLADEYAERGDWRNAVTIYEAVAQGVLEQYGTVHDEEGEVGAVVHRCVAGMGNALSAAADDVEREAILHAIFEVYAWHVNVGGIGIGDTARRVLLHDPTPAERQRLAQWVQAALPVGDDGFLSWRKQEYGQLLIALVGDEADDETYLRICRDTHRLGDLVTRLLDRGRVAEAVAALPNTHVLELLQLADIFVRYNQAEHAERAVAQRAEHETDLRLPEWLKERARTRGDLHGALTLADKLFWARPTLPGYTELKEFAEPLGLWEAARPTLIARLARQAQFPLLTEIHLVENEIDQALQTVQQVGMHAVNSLWSVPLYPSESLRARVAQAAEVHQPQDAIALYLDMVDKLIAARGRDNYTVAAEYLVRVRALYQRLGEEEYWQLFIADLRDQHRRLRALWEELNRAGL